MSADPSPTAWVGGLVQPGSSLLVLKHTRLWPMEMWWSSSDEDTFVMVTPIITPGDCCGVIDVLEDMDNGRTYAALVVCSEGIGCVIASAEHFRVL